MTTMTIPSRDGGMFSAYMSMPETDQAMPAIIVIQEIFGVNENMKVVCDNLSQLGYMVVCPDLFWRQEANVELSDKSEEDMAKAMEFYKNFNEDKGVDDLISTLDFIRQSDACAGYVGAIGFCLGGKLAYLMAARSNIDCTVSYYGVGLEKDLDENLTIQKPFMMHVAAEDEFVPKETWRANITAFKDNQNIISHVYDGAGHAFARMNGEHFNVDAAKQANLRTADFLATYLTD